MMHQIYGLTDPRTGEIRYIGQTSQPLPARLYLHIWDSKRAKHKTRKEAWICSLLQQGLQPGMTLLEDADDWKARERYWIGEGRALGWDLLNHTDGGEGTKGYKHTSEARAKIAAANKLKVGLKRSPEAVENIRKSQLGRKHSLETRAKLSKAGALREHSAESLEKMRQIHGSPGARERSRQGALKRWGRSR